MAMSGGDGSTANSRLNLIVFLLLFTKEATQSEKKDPMKRGAALQLGYKVKWSFHTC